MQILIMIIVFTIFIISSYQKDDSKFSNEELRQYKLAKNMFCYPIYLQEVTKNLVGLAK